MLREGWNFHNDIAIRLEKIARKEFGYTQRPYDTKCDADCIEQGSFYEVMMGVLRHRDSRQYYEKQIEEFEYKYASFKRKKISDFDAEIIQNAFDEFSELYNSIEK